jgi:hypothetical protein
MNEGPQLKVSGHLLRFVCLESVIAYFKVLDQLHNLMKNVVCLLPELDKYTSRIVVIKDNTVQIISSYQSLLDVIRNCISPIERNCRITSEDIRDPDHVIVLNDGTELTISDRYLVIKKLGQIQFSPYIGQKNSLGKWIFCVFRSPDDFFAENLVDDDVFYNEWNWWKTPYKMMNSKFIDMVVRPFFIEYSFNGSIVLSFPNLVSDLNQQFEYDKLASSIF